MIRITGGEKVVLVIEKKCLQVDPQQQIVNLKIQLHLIDVINLFMEIFYIKWVVMIWI